MGGQRTIYNECKTGKKSDERQAEMISHNGHGLLGGGERRGVVVDEKVLEVG